MDFRTFQRHIEALGTPNGETVQSVAEPLGKELAHKRLDQVLPRILELLEERRQEVLGALQESGGQVQRESQALGFLEGAVAMVQAFRAEALEIRTTREGDRRQLDLLKKAILDLLSHSLHTYEAAGVIEGYTRAELITLLAEKGIECSDAQLDVMIKELLAQTDMHEDPLIRVRESEQGMRYQIDVDGIQWLQTLVSDAGRETC